MGTRKNEKKMTQQQSGTTSHQGAFKSYDIKQEERALEEWASDRTPLEAGTAATFGRAMQDLLKASTGGTIDKISFYIE